MTVSEAPVEQDTDAKLRALIRLIVYRCPGISMAELCTLCCLCDMEHYRQTGKPLTGAEYIKLDDDSEQWKRMEHRYLYPAAESDERVLEATA